MKETVTGGKKEFVYSVLWSVLILFFGRALTFALPRYKVVGGIITLLLFCVLGFFVMTRYAAVYTYELKGQKLRINRRIGQRNKEAETAVSDIKYFGKKKPDKMPELVYTMRARVFPNKRVRYVIYSKRKTEYGLVFEPSEKFLNKLQRLLAEKVEKNG